MREEWLPVEDFPGYSISPMGWVRNDDTGRVLSMRINQYGVPYVGLTKNWKQHIRSLPRLVAEAFVEKPNNIYDTPINLDGDRTNCRADNLVWRPRLYAVHYAHQFKEPYDNPIQGKIREVETGEIFRNSLDAGCRFGILEREIVLSILNHTLAWPTYQKFELVS